MKQIWVTFFLTFVICPWKMQKTSNMQLSLSGWTAVNLYYQAAILPYKSLHCLQLIQNAAACVLKETVERITFFPAQAFLHRLPVISGENWNHFHAWSWCWPALRCILMYFICWPIVVLVLGLDCHGISRDALGSTVFLTLPVYK